jgi:DNA-binding NtrC family response regulator
MARILVVDNSEDLNDAIASILRRDGHEVDQARSGTEALLHLRDQPRFDVMVLDMKMPDLPGMGVLQQLPPDPPPVIVMTGDPEAVPKPAPAAVRHVLLKMFDHDRLLAAIDDVLKGPKVEGVGS